MFCASDERIVLGSKENLNENMANFSLKVIEKENRWNSSVIRLQNFVFRKFFFSSVGEELIHT